jgi:uncharacterized protein (DUF2062 family)
MIKNTKKDNRILRFLKFLYLKLFKINDSPQRIALGFGIGAFCGIMPAMGPLVSIFLALTFRVNRASALLGSLLTNTWLSLLAFILSIQIGSAIMGMNYKDVYRAWLALFRNFRWPELFKLSTLDITLPVILGYLVISFCMAVAVYLITLLVLIIVKKKGQSEDKSRANLSG